MLRPTATRTRRPPGAILGDALFSLKGLGSMLRKMEGWIDSITHPGRR
jgi:hypothetical protein